MRLSLLALTFAALAASSLSQRTRYDNFKVYRVTPNTIEQAEILRSYKRFINEVDFWAQLRALNKPVEVMVAPRIQQMFVMHMIAKNIQFVEIISDVEKVFQEERVRQIIGPRMQTGRIDFKQYHRYSTIQNYLLQLQRDYPSTVTLEYPGASGENRPISMVKISTGGIGKPAILVDAGIHAREWIAPSMALYMINQLVENPNNSHMIENVDWYIIPVLNPDGYEYSHTNSRLWRKTRSRGTICDGVDGNRNFDFHWMEIGASDNECDEDYGGPRPMSENEVWTIRRMIESRGSLIKLYLTMHSYGNYILYPWGYTSGLPENWRELDDLAQAAADAIASVEGTRYSVGSSTNLLGAAAGGSDDWVMGVGGVNLSYTVELPGGGNMGFDLPPSRILPVVQETFESIKVYHSYINQKYASQ